MRQATHPLLKYYFFFSLNLPLIAFRMHSDRPGAVLAFSAPFKEGRLGNGVVRPPCRVLVLGISPDVSELCVVFFPSFEA